MKDVFARLATDFFSTIVFLALYFITGNILLATGIAIAGAIAQVVWSGFRGEPLSFMTWASLGLVIVLGGATLLTSDPRFVLAKPSIAHFAIGAIMLKRGWMLRYMPPIARGHGDDVMVAFGYVWAGLMALTAALNLVVAWLSPAQWPAFMAVFPMGSKIALFALQYATVRTIVRRRMLAGPAAVAA